jgi:hypothetical protein
VSADGGFHSPDRILAVLTMASMSFLHSSGGGGVNVFLAGHASGGSLIHGSPSWYGVPGPMSPGSTVGLVPMSATFISPGIQNHSVSGSDLVRISITLVPTNSW